MSPTPGRSKGILGADLLAPAVTITSPAPGANITTVVNLQATATDIGSGVKNVQWKVDGVNFGALQTVSPYTVAFDPTAFSVGAHTITAVVTDNAGRSSQSSITVSVQNSRLKDVLRSTSQGTNDGNVVMQFDTLVADQWGNGFGDGVTFYVPAGMDGQYTLWFQVRQPGYGVVGWPNGWSGDGHGYAWINSSRYGQLSLQSWSGSDVNQNNWMTCSVSGVSLLAGDYMQCWTAGGATGLGVINYDARAQFTRTGA